MYPEPHELAVLRPSLVACGHVPSPTLLIWAPTKNSESTELDPEHETGMKYTFLLSAIEDHEEVIIVFQNAKCFTWYCRRIFDGENEK